MLCIISINSLNVIFRSVSGTKLRRQSGVLSRVIISFCPYFRWRKPCVSTLRLFSILPSRVIWCPLIYPVSRLMYMVNVWTILFCWLVFTHKLDLFHFIVVRSNLLVSPVQSRWTIFCLKMVALNMLRWTFSWQLLRALRSTSLWWI